METENQSPKRRARGRAARILRRKVGSSVSAPFIQRRIPTYALQDEEALVRLEDQAEWILQEVGLNILGDPEALLLLADVGATVDGTHVRFPRGLARQLCQTAPEQFLWHGRNAAKVAQVGGDGVVFGPVFGPPYVTDLDRGRRSGDLAAFADFAKLTQASPYLHFSLPSIVEPNELPLNKRHLDMLETLYQIGDKPCFGASSAPERAVDSIEMVRLVFGTDFVSDNIVTGGNLNVNSPLTIDHITTGVMKTYARAGQFVMLAPFMMAGAMAPVTMAAAIAQHHAECMAGIALYQLYQPGAPIVYGNWLTTMDLKTGAPTFGTPEAILAAYAIGQLSRRLGVPLRAGGTYTGSKIADGQAMREGGDMLTASVLSGSHMTIAAAGWLEGGLTAGYEKFVMDLDIVGAMVRQMGGLSLDDDQWGRDAYAETVSGENFLATGHTRKHFEAANYEYALSDHGPFEHWKEAGSLDIQARANRRWKKMLEEFEPPPLDPGIAEALADYVTRRKLAMPDEWY